MGYLSDLKKMKRLQIWKIFMTKLFAKIFSRKITSKHRAQTALKSFTHSDLDLDLQIFRADERRIKVLLL